MSKISCWFCNDGWNVLHFMLVLYWCVNEWKIYYSLIIFCPYWAVMIIKFTKIVTLSSQHLAKKVSYRILGSLLWLGLFFPWWDRTWMFGTPCMVTIRAALLVRTGSQGKGCFAESRVIPILYLTRNSYTSPEIGDIYLNWLLLANIVWV